MPEPAEVMLLATPAPPGIFLLARNGKVAAAVCRDRQLRVWALPDNRLLRSIEIGSRRFDSITISEDGAWIAAGDHDGIYTVWNTATGAEKMRLRMPWYAMTIAFSPDASRLAIAPTGEPVQIYELASGKKIFELQRAVGGTQAVAFSPDGSRIATADADTVVRIYDGRNGELLARYTEFLLEPLAVSFAPDGTRVLAAGGDKVVVALDAATGKAVYRSEKLADPVAYLDVSPDGKLAAAALMHADNLRMPAPFVISEIASGRKVQEWLPKTRLIGGGWTTDGRLLAATGTEKGVQVWRVR